jgi:hypothetical protein
MSARTWHVSARTKKPPYAQLPAIPAVRVSDRFSTGSPCGEALPCDLINSQVLPGECLWTAYPLANHPDSAHHPLSAAEADENLGAPSFAVFNAKPHSGRDLSPRRLRLDGIDCVSKCPADATNTWHGGGRRQRQSASSRPPRVSARRNRRRSPARRRLVTWEIPGYTGKNRHRGVVDSPPDRPGGNGAPYHPLPVAGPTLRQPRMCLSSPPNRADVRFGGGERTPRRPS